jgi:hypothetical protein
MSLHLSEKACSLHLSEKRRSLRAPQGCLGCIMSLHLSEKAGSLHLSEKRRSLRASQGCLGCLISPHLSEEAASESPPQREGKRPTGISTYTSPPQREPRRNVLSRLCVCIPSLLPHGECVWWVVVSGGGSADLAVLYPPTSGHGRPHLLRNGSRRALCHLTAATSTTLLGLTRGGLGSTVGQVHRTGNRGGDGLPTEGR